MKKNKMMRIASVLLIAVLLTASVISGTFAKYVTSDNTEDHARVAKFGVVVLGEGSLFDTTYFYAGRKVAGNEPNDVYVNDNGNVTVLTVESSNGDNVVAPGTKNEEGMTISVAGAPEVDVLITFDIDLDASSDIFLGQTYLNSYPDLTRKPYYTEDGEMTSDETFKLAYGTYYPIRYTVTGFFVEDNMDAIKEALEGRNNVNYTDNSVTGTLADVQVALASINTYVDANTDLSEIGTLKLTWEWPFEGVDLNRVVSRTGATSRYTAEYIDRMDTLLGDLAAGPVKDVDESMYSLNVNIALSITVTQVD